MTTAAVVFVKSCKQTDVNQNIIFLYGGNKRIQAAQDTLYWLHLLFRKDFKAYVDLQWRVSELSV